MSFELAIAVAAALAAGIFACLWRRTRNDLMVSRLLSRSLQRDLHDREMDVRYPDGYYLVHNETARFVAVLAKRRVEDDGTYRVVAVKYYDYETPGDADCALRLAEELVDKLTESV